jgi:hypothetical protein
MILCEFLCKNRGCRSPIVLPRYTLLQPSEHREIPPTGIPCVALVCTRCKTVESYSEADLSGSVVGETAPSWEVVELLKCVEGSCQLLVPLFAKWSEATTAQVRAADILIWRWHPLACDAGHEVPKPVEVYGYRL